MAFKIKYCNANSLQRLYKNSSLNSHVYWDIMYIIQINEIGKKMNRYEICGNSFKS